VSLFLRLIHLLAAWLCYHARHNEVYFDGRLVSDSIILQGLPFSNIPDLENVDFVVTDDRILDLKAPGLSYLTSIDDTPGEDATCAGIRDGDFSDRFFPD
jgi:hypothetical protein